MNQYEVVYQLDNVGVQRQVVSANSEYAARRIVLAMFGEDNVTVTEVRTVR